MKKLLMIPLLIAMFIVTLLGVQAEQLCFPDQEICGQYVESIVQECSYNPEYCNYVGVCWDKTCEEIINYGFDCTTQASMGLCLDAFQIGDYFYCNIDNFRTCPSGCNLQTNECNGDNPAPSCNEGYMKCGSGNTYNPNGHVFRCVNGDWENWEACPQSTDMCVEYTYNYATCERKNQYYCLNSNDECFKSDRKAYNCFDTLDSCKNGIDVYCYDPLTNNCVNRKGQCKDGERTFKGQGSFETCQDQIDDSKPSIGGDIDVVMMGGILLGGFAILKLFRVI